MQLFGSKFVKNAYSCFVAKDQRTKDLFIFLKWLNKAVWLNKAIFSNEIALVLS